MSTKPDTSADFRDAAVAESRKLLAAAPGLAPLDVMMSLCLPTDGNARQRGPIVYRELALGATSIGGFMLSLGIGAVFESRVPEPWKTPAIAVALILAAMTGVGIFVWVGTGLRRQRRHLQRLYEGRRDAFLLPEARSIEAVQIENSATYDKLKVLPEDLGLLTLDAPNCRVLIEGITHRYAIYAEDVRAIYPTAAGGSRGCTISYAVGDVTLTITVGQDVLIEHVKSAVGLSPRSRMFDLIVRGLGATLTAEPS